ncbi:LysR family transcriptional regulator [Azospirillum sp. TSO35-2]|uniref:LysR family transcriptional regulator n=1 Tax=Azospirillum sp. TSO35-2 TaxID=716796 RepID=UPI000D652194|nr:LysR family transcriptional regulator [Azospirillum sp. TSO35-2]
MELRHLHHLATLAEAGSFHRAAKQLGLRQPALSQSIRALEVDVGAQLVVRNSSGSTLTPAGAVFLSETRYVTHVLERATHVARIVASGSDAPVRLGVSRDAATNYLSKSLELLIKKFSCDVVVSSGSPSNLLAMLGSEILDIALLPMESVTGNFYAESLWTEDIHVVLPEGHPLSAEEVVDIRHLSKYIIVIESPDYAGSADALLLAAGHALGLELRVTTPLSNLEVRLALVSAGLGIAVQPVSNILMLPGGVVARPLVPRLAVRIVAACSTAGLTVPARRFIEATRLVTAPTL